MASPEWARRLLLIIITCNVFCVICSKKVDHSTVIDDITDIKEFKKLLRTKTNVLVLFTKSAQHSNVIFEIFKSVSESIKGEGTLVHIDCSGESKTLCKKLKISSAPYTLKHFKDGEFHKDYDRKETAQSMISFMRNPTGDIPWEEDETAVDILHVSDASSLEKLLSKETRPMLMMFYAPWCGFCKKLKPEYSQAAKELKKTAILAAMDVNKPENTVIRHHFNITGFPTLMYFERGRAPQVYEGENNKDAIVNFIKNPRQPPQKAKEQDWQDVPSDVVHLTDSTFDSYLTTEPSILVMFYAPWCGHCKAMKPEYQNAASKMKLEKIPGTLAAVDATKETSLGEKFGIKGYPTVKYYKNGEWAYDVSYRTADEIIEFMKDPKEPPPPPPPETPWHETESRVWHLEEGTFKNVLKKKKHALVMFYAPWCGHCKRAKPEFEKAAERLQDDVQVAFAAVDCTTHTSLCNTYQVQGFPTIKYFSYMKNSTDYDGERSEESFVKFMSDPQKMSSQGAASEDFWIDEENRNNVIQLTASDFHEYLDAKESALVLFYAPWCSFSKKARSPFVEAATNMKKENVDAVFAAVDATVEKSLAKKYGVKKYPIIKYFRYGVEIKTYEGKRTALKFQNFMRNPPNEKDEL